VLITTRNARFQQWQALLTNRTKRQRTGEFLVQGVRPISLAAEHGWTIRALLYAAETDLSRWAERLLDEVPAQIVEMAPELLAELGEKEADRPELVAVVALPDDDLSRIGDTGAAVVFDRPANPGNIGTLVRSADAFGAAGVIVTGHAADPYDPRAVRASTGSLFAVPAVRAPSHVEVLAWAAARGLHVAGTDEQGDVDVADYDFTQPTLLVVGNETTGMSTAWRQACGTLLRIPMSGAASSLNAATAGSIVLYESSRQMQTGRVGT
jgi:23S rRNA (uridine2479-2'-O)-methyltransferase